MPKIKIDNKLYEIDKVPEINKKIKHDISILVDRIIINSSLGNRLAESVETCVNLGDGLIHVEYENETLPKKFRKEEKLVLSTKFACPESSFTIEEIEPRLFSFNSPYGACEECDGIGVKLNVDPKLVIPNEKKTISDGAIEPWSKSSSLYYAQTLSSLSKHYEFSLNDKWKKLTKKIREIILFGSDDDEIKTMKTQLDFLKEEQEKSPQVLSGYQENLKNVLNEFTKIKSDIKNQQDQFQYQEKDLMHFLENNKKELDPN